MSPLQFIIIIASFVFVIFGIDLFQRKKANFLHFLVFVGGGVAVGLFSYDYSLLNKFGKYFGVARGADIIVYMALIALAYFYIEMINQFTKQKFHFTRLISAQAINDGKNKSRFITPKLGNDKKSEFCFLIRAYNEDSAIGIVIDQILDAGYSKILVVNDGSRDKTADIVQSKIDANPEKQIMLISHLINRGGGAANKTGFEFVKQFGDKFETKRIVGFDADGQMDILNVQRFQDAIDEDIKSQGRAMDCYLGSRFVDGGGSANMPFVRRVVLRGSKVVTYIFNGIRVSDPHNGLRVISLDAIKQIKINSDGMAYANEINDEIRKHKLSYREIPVLIHYTEYSLGKGQKNSNAFRILFELIYKKLFFK